jgi:NADPH-dependent ferric siderophore reductase
MREKERRMSDVVTNATDRPMAALGGRPVPVPEGVDPVMFARRMGRLWTLTVTGAADLTPRMRRVSLTGDELGGWRHKPGQEIILLLPQAGGDPIRRHYTIRAFDEAERRLDVDFVLHGDSPATRWARAAKPGDVLDIMGPRGRIVVDHDAEWHLFSGDETCIPAIAGMIESLAPNTRAFAFIEIGGQAERQAIETAADLTLEWLDRGGAHPGPNRLLIDRLAAFELPPGRGQAYVIGETSNVRAQRQALIGRGFPREAIAAEGYWRPGRVGGHDHVDDRH